MGKLYRKIKSTAGLAPGALVYTGEAAPASVKITLFDYDKDRAEERTLASAQECTVLKDSSTVSWINVDGLDAGVVEKIGALFDLHPLVLEDVLNVGQRPKMEDYGEYLFIVLKMLSLDPAGHGIATEQITLILGRHYVLSFQERPGDIFDPIRDRIRTNKGRVRKAGADYLIYCLTDAIVDQYFSILESMGERIEELEERITVDRDGDAAKHIHRLRRDVIYLRRQIWPLREVVNMTQRDESQLFTKATAVFLRDVYDHAIQAIDTIELFRDMLAGMHDIYLSTVSNKMNEVMKILTMFASIFIPLTFLAGVYGMNFRYMPELHWRWGYFVLLGIMASIATGMLVFFKRKKWF